MDADALFLGDVADDLVAEDRMAALGDVRCDRVESVYHDGIVAVSSSGSVGPCISGRLCSAGSCGLEVDAGLVRIDAQSIDLCDIVIDDLLGGLGSLCFRALGITGLVSFAEFDRKLVRAVCDVAVSGYAVAQGAALLFRDISDIVVTQARKDLAYADGAVA